MTIERDFTHFSATLGALLLTLAACSADTPVEVAPAETTAGETGGTPAAGANPTGSGEKVTVTIDNAIGGKIALADGTELDVPAGALPPGVETITVSSSTIPAPAEYRTVAPIYVFGPDGTVFLKPVTISFPVTVPGGTNTADLTILWSRPRGQPGFDMVPGTFTPVGGKANTYTVSGEVNHFSEGTCGFKFTSDPHPSLDPYGD